MARPVRKYDTDPPSASAQGGIVLPFSIFDTPRLMYYIRRGLVEGIPPLENPSDEMLIATVVAHGMPRWSADQMRYNPMLRLHYYMFWLDVREAAKGNIDAQERVDSAVDTWRMLRRDELISDLPHMSAGFYER